MVPAPEKVEPMPDGISHTAFKFLIIGSIVHFASIIFVILRFCSRRLTRSIGLEDWMSLVVLIFAIAFSIAFTLLLTIGRAGYHQYQLSQPELETYSKLTLSCNVLYTCTISLAKISILLFLKRVFAIHQSFCRYLYVMQAVVILYATTIVLGMIFPCHPVEAQWKPWLPRKCIAAKPFSFSGATINIVLDVVILLSPQPLVWRLQMSWKRKLLVSSLLMVGGAVCVMSIIRFVTLQGVDGNDVVYTGTKSHAWSLFELNTSIYCICMPMIPSLIRHWKRKYFPGNSGTPRSSDVYSNTLGLTPGRRRLDATTILQDSTEGLYADVELMERGGPHGDAKGVSVRVQTDIIMEWETTSSRTRAGSV